MNKRYTLYLLGFLAIASTYLPVPYDNLCYPLLAIFLYYLLKWGRLRDSLFHLFPSSSKKETPITLKNVLLYGSIVVISVILFVSLATIYAIRNDPSPKKPAGLTPYGEFLYKLAKSF